MKTFAAIALSLFAATAFAIEFILEDDVQATLKADKVIEISKYVVQDKLLEQGTKCHGMLFSKSGRAYIVKTANKVFVAATLSGLADLEICVEL